MGKKLFRGKKPTDSTKEVVASNQNTAKEVEVVPPIEPLYLLTPVERANALPDYSGVFNRSKHLQLLNNSVNSDLATLERITKFGKKHASIHELQIFDMIIRSINTKDPDRHVHQKYIWERLYGNNVQKIEHSGNVGSISEAQLIEQLGLDRLSPEEFEKIVRMSGET